MMPCPCGKNTRERLYCHRPDCGTLVAVDLPRPDVIVTEQTHVDSRSMDVVVSRDGKAKSYTGTGFTSANAAKEAIEKLLGDPHTAEWLPK